MGIPFNRQTYTTTLSPQEALDAVSRMLNSKSKVLFWFISSCAGSIEGNKFALTSNGQKNAGPYTCKIKGTVVHGSPTRIELHETVSILSLIMFFSMAVIIFWGLFQPGDILINGVSREFLLVERLGYSLILSAVPALIIYFGTLWPLRRIKKKVIEDLKLVKLRKALE